MGITIKDVAKLSGVGISTVSRVINKSGPVSEETREKVMQVVQEYGYIPNISARNLKSTKSKTVALLIKDITNPFLGRMLRIIEREIALRGYLTLIRDVSAENEMEIARQEAQDYNLCGVIIMGGYFAYSDDDFHQLDIPCVLLTISADEKVNKNLYSSVRIDDEKEGYRAAEYLISLGHKRIAYLFRPPENEKSTHVLRYKGYVRALCDNGISFDADLAPGIQSYVGEDGFVFSKILRAIQELCGQCKDITAVVTFSDYVAVCITKAIFTIGLRVPEDISIIGFDGVEIAEICNPSLDTIYQPATEMALSATEILFDMMRGGPTQHIVYDTVLLKRGSSRAIDEI